MFLWSCIDKSLIILRWDSYNQMAKCRKIVMPSTSVQMGTLVITWNSLLCKRKRVLLKDELLVLREFYFKNDFTCLNRMKKYLLSLSSMILEVSLFSPSLLIVLRGSYALFNSYKSFFLVPVNNTQTLSWSISAQCYYFYRPFKWNRKFWFVKT